MGGGTAWCPGRRRRASCAQRRVASWGVALAREPPMPNYDPCSTPGGVVGGGTSSPRSGAGENTCAQRRVASWGVARAYTSIQERLGKCSTPGGVVGGGTPSSCGRGPRPRGAQRRVASWGVARTSGGRVRSKLLVLNAGWRRGGWHTSTVTGRSSRSGAQRRVASWGVARAYTSIQERLGKCSTPGGVVGGGTRAGRRREPLYPVLNAGWRRGGWHSTSKPGSTWLSGAQRRVASWGVAPLRARRD